MTQKLFIGLILAGSLAWANSLGQIRNSKVVRIGVGDSIPPFANLVDGEFVGFEIKLAKELGRRIFNGNPDGKVELVGMSARDRIPGLQNNKVDMVVRAFSVTKDRRKLVDFSTPYFSTDISILTNKEDKIKSIKDLKGKKIIALESTTGYKRALKLNLDIVSCINIKECFEKFENKEGVGFIHDNTVLLGYIVKHPNTELGIKSYGRSFYTSVGVAKGNGDLLRFIDKQIVDLSSKKFFEEAFNNDLDPFYKGTANKKYFLLDELYGALKSL